MSKSQVMPRRAYLRAMCTKIQRGILSRISSNRVVSCAARSPTRLKCQAMFARCIKLHLPKVALNQNSKPHLSEAQNIKPKLLKNLSLPKIPNPLKILKFSPLYSLASPFLSDSSLISLPASSYFLARTSLPRSNSPSASSLPSA